MSFERHTRRKIKNHPSEVDTDALWNSIKNDIPQEKDKKKRGIFFLFFGIALTGSIIVSSYGHLLIPEKNKAGSAIAIHQKHNHSDQEPKQYDYFSSTIINRIPNKNLSGSATEIVSIQPEYSTNSIEEKEIPHNNPSDLTIADDKVSNISSDDLKVVSYIKPTEEIKKEVLSLLVPEKDDYFPLADGIANAKNIPVEGLETDEELIHKIELQEEELEEEKKESKEKRTREEPSYSLFTHTDASVSLKGKTINTQDIPGIISARQTLSLIAQHAGISKDFGNKIVLSSDIYYAVLSEKITFESIKIDGGTAILDSGPRGNVPSVLSHAEIKESSSAADNNSSNSNTGSIGGSNSVNLEAINKTKFFGLSFSLAYKKTFKNEKVFLLLGAGTKININTLSTGYIRSSGFNNRISNGFIAQQDAINQKDLTISPTLSSSFNLELNSKTYVILGAQYQANPNLFGMSAGIRFKLGSK